MILKLLTVLVVTFTEVTVVIAVTLTPATHTFPSTFTLYTLVVLAGLSQGVLVLLADGALTDPTDVAFLAAKLDPFVGLKMDYSNF